MPSGISVIICCFNSSLRIAPTLQHLVAQKNILSSSWEVILVDNGSKDNTAETALQIWNSFNEKKPPFKIVTELEPGLSAARRKGIEKAFFDYILFCDDDNWLDDNYLSIGLGIMQTFPGIGALGGTGRPVFEDKEPPYFWANQFHVLAVGMQSEVEGDITNGRGVLYGAGMLLNKSAFNVLKEKFRFKFQLTDRIGTSLASSGDHELCLALKKAGYRIYYSKKMKFQHFIPKHRTTIQYYKQLFLGFGISYALLHAYRVNRDNLHSLKNDYRYICLRSLKNIMFTRIKLLVKGYYFGFDQYKCLDELHHLYNDIGILRTFILTKNRFKDQFNSQLIFSPNS
ncbi:MAG: hypothetical protein JWP81_2682 [Ferruginibacter sp.]|nr:hypothetical protein [Ferruginibacter sp.]